MTPSAPRWLLDARAEADRPPAVRRDPLSFDGCTFGSVEPGLAARIVAAGLPLARDGDGWELRGPIDASLAEIAAWLHRERLAAPWRSELLAVTDASGGVLGAVERAVVRVLGVTTFAVHLTGRAVDGGTWVQQRAFSKAIDAGQWDTLMGGQVAAVESTETSLARETMEEAGLDIATLLDVRQQGRLAFRRPVPEGYLVEHIDVYACTLPAGSVPNNLDGEVERFECLRDAALEARLASRQFTLEATLILADEIARRRGG